MKFKYLVDDKWKGKVFWAGIYEQGVLLQEKRFFVENQADIRWQAPKIKATPT